MEIFRAAVNNKTTLNVGEVMEHVRPVIDDNGKSQCMSVIVN